VHLRAGHRRLHGVLVPGVSREDLGTQVRVAGRPQPDTRRHRAALRLQGGGAKDRCRIATSSSAPASAASCESVTMRRVMPLEGLAGSDRAGHFCPACESSPRPAARTGSADGNARPVSRPCG
jgi:hypothetical protein